MHVYVLEHIVSLNYRIAWWIFTKLGRDKVLMTPHICIDSWAKSAQGWIQGGAKIGPGGSLLQRTSSSDRKATATHWMHSSDLEAFGKKYCNFWFHWEVKFLTRFGRLFGLSHFGVLQTGRLQQHTLYWMHTSDLEAFGKKYCNFWFHWEVKFLTRFGRLFGLSHFGVF